MTKPTLGDYRVDSQGRIVAMYNGDVWVVVMPRIRELEIQLQFVVDYMDSQGFLDDHCFTFPDGETIHATKMCRNKAELPGESIKGGKMYAYVTCGLKADHPGPHYDGYSSWT